MLKIQTIDRGTMWLGWNRYRGGIWQVQWSAPNAPKSVTRLSRAVLRLLDAAVATQKKRESMQAAGEFTDAGIVNALIALVSSQVGPAHYRLHHEIVAADRILQSLKTKLATPQVDKTDIAAAILRMQIRQHLSSLDVGKRIQAVLKADPVTLQAVLEGPTYLVGVPDDVMQQVQNAAYKAAAPEIVAEIEMLEDAIESAKALQGIIVPAAQETLKKNQKEVEALLLQNIEAETRAIAEDRSRESADPTGVLALLKNLNADALDQISKAAWQTSIDKKFGSLTAA